MAIDISRLLNSVIRINDSYDRVLKSTGENFNIFRILKIQNDEIRLHSSFIGELLNPKGSHGQNDIFLKSFLNVFNVPGFNTETEIKAQVILEEFAGKVNLEEGTGGRIDIVLKINDKVVVIENKIYAGDQNKQLIRYRNKYQNAHLIYLTLNGRPPEGYSVKCKETNRELKPNVDYFTASYTEEIINWLIECRKQSVQHTLLRETISQYINLIKYLTGQTMNTEKQDAIVNVITESGENIKAAIETTRSINKAKKYLLTQFVHHIKERVNSEINNLHCSIDPNFGRKYCGMRFHFVMNNNIGVFLSFASEQSDPYLEIFNEENKKDKKIVKKPENIEFYSTELNMHCGSWGKIINVNQTWHGDWVCRYDKINFMDLEFWAALANKDYRFAEEVGSDIIILLKAIQNKNTIINSN